MNRRGFLTGLTALVTAPVIVRAESLMPVKLMVPENWLPCDGRWVSKRLYPELFARLGNTYSDMLGMAGKFKLPDFTNEIVTRNDFITKGVLVQPAYPAKMVIRAVPTPHTDYCAVGSVYLTFHHNKISTVISEG